jgi:hypothetical protein
MSTVALGGPSTLTIKQGRSLIVEFGAANYDGTPMNLSGYSVAGEIRLYADGPLLSTLHCSIPRPDTGVVRCTLSAAETAALERSGFYDLRLVQPNGDVVDFVAGPAVVKASVTP